MPTTQLQFYPVGSYPYPYATTGSGSALTVCRRYNDPYLAFLTQTYYEDEIVFLFLHLSVSQEAGRLQTPPGHDVISGMDYAIFRNIIWAVQSTQNQDTIIGLDPETGNVTDTILVPPRSGAALAYNGLYFVRSDGNVLEAISNSGVVIGSVNVPLGSSVQGLTAAPWSYVASDTSRNRLLVLNVFGNIMAKCPNPLEQPAALPQSRMTISWTMTKSHSCRRKTVPGVILEPLITQTPFGILHRG